MSNASNTLEIETRRLVLRPLTRDDLDDICRIWNDAQFWNYIKRMGQAREPLITINGVDLNRAFAGNGFHGASFELTEKGRDVLSGKSDCIDINGLDMW